MASLTPDSRRRRIVALGAVGAVHGVMAVAILTGFAGGLIRAIEKKSLPAWNYAPPKPTVTPEPVPSPMPHPRDAKPMPDTNPLPKTPIDTNPGLDPLPPLPFDGGLGPDPLPPLPTASPSPTFIPRAAQPLGLPGRWVSDADYPASALRRGDQGVTGFEITVGQDGRVRDCRIARTSGSADLDAATCARLTQRARFTPARDEHGDLVMGRYSGVIRWQIPE